MGNDSAAHALSEKDKRKKTMRKMTDWWVWGVEMWEKGGDKEINKERNLGLILSHTGWGGGQWQNSGCVMVGWHLSNSSDEDAIRTDNHPTEQSSLQSEFSLTHP